MSRIAVIVFSPAGSTLKTANLLADRLTLQGAEVQVLEISRNTEYYRSPDRTTFLREAIGPHDLLCLGGPVYAHRLQFTLLELIAALPEPGGAWGRLAAVFVNYGTINSGQALHDAARKLRRGGRTPVLAMKLDSFHSVTREFAEQINPGRPGKEAEPVIDEMAARMVRAPRDAFPIDVTPSLRYHTAFGRLKDALLFRERFMGRLAMPTPRFSAERCSRCGACVAACPVLRLDLDGRAAPRSVKGRECIHCGECRFACPAEAVRFSMRRFEKAILAGGRGRGLLASGERPKSVVYPILRSLPERAN